LLIVRPQKIHFCESRNNASFAIMRYKPMKRQSFAIRFFHSRIEESGAGHFPLHCSQPPLYSLRSPGSISIHSACLADVNRAFQVGGIENKVDTRVVWNLLFAYRCVDKFPRKQLKLSINQGSSPHAFDHIIQAHVGTASPISRMRRFEASIRDCWVITKRGKSNRRSFDSLRSLRMTATVG